MYGECGKESIGIGPEPRWPVPWWKGTPSPLERYR